MGDTELLRKLGRKYGFRVIVIEPVMLGDEVVSSTKIRNYILEGDMERVFAFWEDTIPLPERLKKAEE